MLDPTTLRSGSRNGEGYDYVELNPRPDTIATCNTLNVQLNGTERRRSLYLA